MTTRAVLSPSMTTASPVARRRHDGPERARPRPGLRAFQTPVRGHAFAAAPAGSSAPEAGMRARLAREPANPADPLAVAVWITAADDPPWRIGYLDRGVAARVAPRLDDGMHVDARVEGWICEPEGRWHRPLVRLVPDTATTTRRPADRAPDATSAPPQRSSVRPASTERRTDAGAAGATQRAGAAALWGRPPGVVRRTVPSR